MKQEPVVAPCSGADRNCLRSRRRGRQWSDEGALPTAVDRIRSRTRNTAADLPDEPTPERVDTWVESAELLQDPEFRTQMRRVAEFNAADQDRAAVAGRSVWFPMRLLQLGTEARARGIAPESPEAEAILREVLGDGDLAVVLERMESASNDRLARYRELLSLVKGAGTPSAHRAEFGWVVAALRAGADR